MAGIAAVCAATCVIAELVVVNILPISIAFCMAKIIFANFSFSPTKDANAFNPCVAILNFASCNTPLLVWLLTVTLSLPVV